MREEEERQEVKLDEVMVRVMKRYANEEVVKTEGRLDESV